MKHSKTLKKKENHLFGENFYFLTMVFDLEKSSPSGICIILSQSVVYGRLRQFSIATTKVASIFLCLNITEKPPSEFPNSVRMYNNIFCLIVIQRKINTSSTILIGHTQNNIKYGAYLIFIGLSSGIQCSRSTFCHLILLSGI